MTEVEEVVAAVKEETVKEVAVKAAGMKRKQVGFIYGNYPHYYGYRVGRSMDDDPRLKFFERKWFENRDCLDIGCNEGHVTIAVAERFCPKSMLGVDIDGMLIGKARENLNAASKTLVEADDDDVADDDDAEKEKNLTGEELLGRLKFRSLNYIETKASKQAYDTILCLSVTKWIHLNWGDDGIIKLFSKMHSELRDGGMLVLEPQPWSSYKKKRRVSDIARTHYDKAALRPDDFPHVLTDKIGFKTFEEISAAVPESNTGFERPLFVYYK